ATPGLIETLAPLAGSVDSLDRVISTRSAEYDALVTGSELRHPDSGSATERAWLFYTSGTTGRPKGAVLTHRNLLFMSQCYYADIDTIDERDTHLAAAPLSHGAGLYALPFVLKGAHQLVLPHFDVPAITRAGASDWAPAAWRAAGCWSGWSTRMTGSCRPARSAR